MNPKSRPLPIVLFLAMASLCLALPVSPLFAQTEQVDGKEAAEDAKQDPKETTESPEDVVDTSDGETEGIGNRFVRFHMWDGTVVSGEIKTEFLSVKTEFGMLQVPISEISRFMPGLDSIPKLNEKIMALVEQLGDKDFDVREKSHRELSGMGTMLRNEISKFDDGGSAERKKRLSEIKKEIDETVDEQEDDGSTVDGGMIRGDRIETSDFSIVGKIQQDEFALSTKFGDLKLKLSEIKMGDRSFRDARSEITKSITVGGETFFQRKPLSTRIRVNPGDVIKIRASGMVRWTNWNTSSTPDGISNQGDYLGIMCGTLIARIGDSGKPIKIGTKGEFVAKKSGVLFLAIAVTDNHAKQNGYHWTGDYKAKVKVQPVN